MNASYRIKKGRARSMNITLYNTGKYIFSLLFNIEAQAFLSVLYT